MMCKQNYSISIFLILCFSFFLVCGAVIGSGAGPSSWQGLTPGEYAVGFATIETYDLTRTYSPSKDYFGNLMEGETARPIQICYWYPALTDESSTPMIYGEYAYPYPEDSRFIDILSALQNREIGLLTFFLNNNRGLLTAAMNTEMFAVRDADWADGQFPIIVIHNDANSTFTQNLVLAEYLASRGYVVVTSHCLGQTAINPVRSAIDVEMMTRDKEFILGEMFQFEQVDKNRIGIVGASFGTISSLIQAMRSPEIDALVLLESTSRVANRDELLTGSLFYQTETFNAPMLQVYSSASFEAEEILTNMFKYSDRLTVNRSQSEAMDFMTYPMITGPLTDSLSKPETYAQYTATCIDIGMFFDKNVKQVERTLGLMTKYVNDETVLVNSFPGDEAPPTASQFLAMFNGGKAEQAIELEEEFQMFSPDNAPVDENTLNMTGYQYLQRGNSEIALAIFKMATLGFPESPNVWDSYGEACVATGDNISALASYRKALELAQNTENNLPQNLRDAILNGAPETIERLETLIAEQGKTEK